MGYLIALAVLLVLSGFFSATETAFTSLNTIRLKNMASGMGKKAQKAARTLRLAEQYDKLLSTLLIGNNIVNILSASLATVLFTGWFGDMGVTLSTVVMTVLVLIFGEISPKTLAKEYPEGFAMAVTPVVRGIMAVMTPLSAVFSLWKRLLGKLFRFESRPNITEDELKTIIDEVESEGVIGSQESELIRSAMDFDEVTVEEILTPRVELEAVQEEESMEAIRESFLLNGYSRMPVYGENIDDIKGVIHEKDFYRLLSEGKSSIESIISPVLYVTENKKIAQLLRELQKSHSHMAVVVDEYGGTTGIITLEDILEELVGEIWDEHDEVVEYFKKLDENHYRIDCAADLEDMFELVGYHCQEEELSHPSVSGWVTEELQKIPSVGDFFDYGKLHVTVTKTDARRVLEIEVEVRPPEKKEELSEEPEDRRGR